MLKFNVFLIFIFLIYGIASDKKCPSEIQEYISVIESISPGDYFRFSSCFYCTAYYRYKKMEYMCLLNNIIYEFKNKNNCQNEFDLSAEIKGCYYKMLVNPNGDKLDIFISYIDENQNINIFHYSFIYNSESLSLPKSIIVKDKRIKNPKALSCEYLNNSDDYHLICFYIIKPNLYAEIFDINDNLSSIKKVNTSCNCEDYSNDSITIISSKNNDKILVFWEEKDNNAYYITFNPSNYFAGNYGTFGECETRNLLMEACFYEDYFYFICQLKLDKEKYKFYKMKNNGNNFGENYEYQIDSKGFLLENWFYSKSYDNCNFNIYTCPFNDLGVEIINAELNNIHLYSNSLSMDAKNNIKEKNILDNTTDLLKDKEPGKVYKIKEKDYSITIKPSNSAKEPNSTYINFTECESILRNHYNISDSSVITILQLELYNNDSQSLINQVEYEAYGEDFKKLNLNLCKNVNIPIFYSLKEDILMDMDLDKINSLKNLGIDVFDINDSFFWDVCQPYSDTGDDLILADRIKDIYQNYSLCEEGCTYNDLSLENMTVLCDCKIKDNITTKISEINLDQIKYITSSNFDVIKCYNIILKFKIKYTNIGFWIFSILLILHFPLIFHYFYTGIQPVYNFVIKQMNKNGYIYKNNNNIKNKSGKTSKKNTKKKNNNSPPRKNAKNNNNKIVNNFFIIGNNSLKKKAIKNKEANLNNKRFNKKNKIKKINFSNNKKNIDNSRQLMKKKRTKLNLSKMQTQNPDEGKNNNKKSNIIDFPLITIDLNKKNHKEYFPKKSYRILNNYTFEEAIKYDMRSICEIYFIYLLSKQIIFHAIFFRSPFQLFSLRLCLLIFIFSSDLALNAFFYFEDNISKKYRYAKSLFLFTFSNNITVIILSTFIGFILLTLFTKLSNSTNAIREIFRNEEEKIKKNKKYKVTDKRKKEIKEEIDKIFKNYKIKIIVFISFEFLFMIFFWYYVSIFCHVYPSTQTSWLFDSFLSILSRFIIDNLICIGLAKLYRIGVESNVHCLYKFALLLYEF